MSMDLEDIKKFKLIHDRSTKIKNHEFLYFSFGMKMKAEKSKPVLIESNFPDDNLLRSYSTLIRPFYNNNDPISFLRICNFISNPNNDFDQKYKQKTINASETWKMLLQTKTSDPSSSGVVLNFNDIKITSSELIDLYFNGDIFHNDMDKVERIRTMELPMFGEQMQMNFFDVIQKMGRLIVWIDEDVISKLLEQKTGD